MRIRIDDRQTLTKFVLLFSVFDGDPDQWLVYLQTEASETQWADDLPFVNWLVWQNASDERFLDDVRELLFSESGMNH